MAVKVVTDSTSYIGTDMQKELDITVIPLTVNFPDESFKETEVDYCYFYEKIEKSNTLPTSSQPSPGEIYSVFADIVSRGHDVLAIFISSWMSGTYESALSVRDMIRQEYPSANIEVLDSHHNTMALGFPAIVAAKAALEGKDLRQIVETTKETIKRMHCYFIPTSLEYLRKGGRIGGAAAIIGSVLQIRPILYIIDGKTEVMERVRGTRKAIQRLLSILDNDYKSYGLKQVIVQHIQDLEKGKEVERSIFKRYGMKVPIVSIGPVLGLHVGPGAIGIVYCTEQQKT